MISDNAPQSRVVEGDNFLDVMRADLAPRISTERFSRICVGRRPQCFFCELPKITLVEQKPCVIFGNQFARSGNVAG
jgi:hypothetical protein